LVNDFFTAQLMTMETIAAGELRATGLPHYPSKGSSLLVKSIA